jgi:capsid portal protein
MELYEALKNGTSKEDLIKAFTEELNAATARFEEDKAAEQEKQIREEEIAAARVKAQDALNEYFELCGVDDTDIKLSVNANDFKDISKIFKAFNPFTIKGLDDDDNIIRQFLKTL